MNQFELDQNLATRLNLPAHIKLNSNQTKAHMQDKHFSHNYKRNSDAFSVSSSMRLFLGTKFTQTHTHTPVHTPVHTCSEYVS